MSSRLEKKRPAAWPAVDAKEGAPPWRDAGVALMANQIIERA
ncbi:hypothetical protein B4113_3882 [Geobacillus sp. B4113_201601]|nr:hypothetical protein B4113_3882 [Geobacillus sp. B4113_201601]